MFQYSSHFFIDWQKKRSAALAGNRTRAPRVAGEKFYHWTTNAHMIEQWTVPVVIWCCIHHSKLHATHSTVCTLSFVCPVLPFSDLHFWFLYPSCWRSFFHCIGCSRHVCLISFRDTSDVPCSPWRFWNAWNMIGIPFKRTKHLCATCAESVIKAT